MFIICFQIKLYDSLIRIYTMVLPYIYFKEIFIIIKIESTVIAVYLSQIFLL